MRTGICDRTTKETKISCSIDLDGKGRAEIETGIGFFDHMLNLLAFHSQMDIRLRAVGDLEVCDHHTIEDCGIALGTAFKEALGDKKGIERYGSFRLVMDEALADVILDISGRPYLVFDATFRRDTIGNYSTEMTREFFYAFAAASGLSLHIHVPYGENDHHKIEAIFKAFARALKQAFAITSDILPSSKGRIEG